MRVNGRPEFKMERVVTEIGLVHGKKAFGGVGNSFKF